MVAGKMHTANREHESMQQLFTATVLLVMEHCCCAQLLSAGRARGQLPCRASNN